MRVHPHPHPPHPPPQPPAATAALSSSSRRALSLLIGLLVASSTAFVFLLSAAAPGGLPRHQAAPPSLQDFYVNIRNDDSPNAQLNLNGKKEENVEHRRRHALNRRASAVDEGTAAVDLFAPEAPPKPPQAGHQHQHQHEVQMQQALASSQEDLGLLASAIARERQTHIETETEDEKEEAAVVLDWDGRNWDDDAHEEITAEDPDCGCGAPAEAVVEGDGEGLTVYMDFAQDRRTWGKAQHRALESVLTRYPEATIVVLQVAPGSYANYHYADALGITQFQKYRKRGYNVDVQIINDFTFLYDRSLFKYVPGVEWWTQEVCGRVEKKGYSDDCPSCSHMANADMRRKLSATINLRELTFVRWAALWMTGGYYTDFSLLWIDGLPQRRFFDMAPAACAPQEDTSPLQPATYTSNTTSADKKEKEDSPNHYKGLVNQLEKEIRQATAWRLVASALDASDSAEGAAAAAGGGAEAGGGGGASDAAAAAAAGGGGAASDSAVGKGGGGRQKEEEEGEEEERLYRSDGFSGRLGSLAMHFHQRDPVLTCGLLRLTRPKYARCFEKSTQYGRDCVRAIMSTCIRHENDAIAAASEDAVADDSSSSETQPKPGYETVKDVGVVQWFDCDPLAGDGPPDLPTDAAAAAAADADDNNQMKKKQEEDGGEAWRLDACVHGRHALWLGRHARAGGAVSLRDRWRDPPAGSLYALAAASPSVINLTKWPPALKTCPKEILEKRQQQPCTRVGDGEGMCAPSLFIPGTQKGASSFLFKALNYHPQVLRPLGGSQYKEPGLYQFHYNEEKVRLWDRRDEYFPYLEPGVDDPFVVSEGTVTYMYKHESPLAILHDNPTGSARLLFSLRDPVARAWSDYRFNYVAFYSKKNLTFRAVVENSLAAMEACLEAQHQQQQDAAQPLPSQEDSEEEEEKDEEDSNDNDAAVAEARRRLKQARGAQPKLWGCRDPDPHRIVFRGIYAPSYEYYLQYFHRASMHVVTAEELRDDEAGTLARVVEFLGLCPYDFSSHDLQPVHVTGNRHVGAGGGSLELERDLEAKLREFYRPFNEQLYKLVGRNLGWEKEAGRVYVGSKGREEKQQPQPRQREEAKEATAVKR